MDYLTKINDIDSMQMLISGEVDSKDQELITLNKCICSINNSVVDILLKYGMITADELSKL